jgi:hypothetical protein
VNRYQANMQNALDDYQDKIAKLAFLSYTNATPIPPCNIKPIWATTSLIMLYIAMCLLAAGGAPVSELQIKILFDQAEKCATEFLQAKLCNPLLNLLKLQISCPPQGCHCRLNSRTPCTHQ